MKMVELKNSNIFNEIINDSITIFSKNCNVVGLLLIGSLAKGNVDHLSDVDIVVVVKNNAEKEIIEYNNNLNHLNEIIISQIMVPENWLSVLYKNNGKLIKVDYDFINYDEFPFLLKDSYKKGTGLLDGVILFENEDGINKVFEEISINRTNKNPDISINQFIIHVYSALRMIKRGELFEAIDIIHQLRDPYIISLLGMLYNFPFENSRRLENRIPKEMGVRLRKTYSLPKASDLDIALSNICELFVDLLVLNNIDLSDNQLSVINKVLKSN